MLWLLAAEYENGAISSTSAGLRLLLFQLIDITKQPCRKLVIPNVVVIGDHIACGRGNDE
jgi:hypothetical protein